ncbi:MAG: hypothetical protein JSW61_09110 [Candidatus Thorarchaeota archaeon]|nr:MAG: hypothetical protein JSW61_09110 [Candidatus Thorarchaeota archaeon]
MSKDPEKLVDEYLERVKVYLPIDSEDTLLEIKTHLLKEAERIGEGSITPGSTLMAIERFGEPKQVANEYAGTGKRIGPVPAEYTQPLIRILLALLGISIAFIVGGYVIGIAFPTLIGDLAAIQNWPFVLPVMIVVNVLFVVLIFGGISLYADRDKLATERTTIEGIFGIGSSAFNPKSRSDAAADVIFGPIFGTLAVLPQIHVLFNPAFVPILYLVAVLMYIGAVKGALFFFHGENNLNLLIEGILAIFWIIIALVMINFAMPIEYAWNNSGSGWELIALTDLAALFPATFDIFVPLTLGWMVLIFVIVVVSSWRVLIAVMKIPMYLQAGKGWWWKGTWGPGRRFRRGVWAQRR